MDLEVAMEGAGDYDMVSSSSTGTPWAGPDDKDGMELDHIHAEEQSGTGVAVGAEEMEFEFSPIDPAPLAIPANVSSLNASTPAFVPQVSTDGSLGGASVSASILPSTTSAPPTAATDATIGPTATAESSLAEVAPANRSLLETGSTATSPVSAPLAAAQRATDSEFNSLGRDSDADTGPLTDGQAGVGAKEGGITGSAAEAALIDDEASASNREAANGQISTSALEGVSGSVVPLQPEVATGTPTPGAEEARDEGTGTHETEKDELDQQVVPPQVVSSFEPRASAPAESDPNTHNRNGAIHDEPQYTDEAQSARENGADVEEAGEEEESEEEEEEEEEPPSVRISFADQDFVLFSTAHSPVYYASGAASHSKEAKEAEITSAEDSASTSLVPVQAPQLSVPVEVFREGLDSLCEHFRVKHALGDFLEEESELVIALPDLQLTVREDDLYAGEVTLADLHRLHVGLGLTGSLHLSISESSRFISRYNALSEQVARLEDAEIQRQQEQSGDGAENEEKDEIEGGGEDADDAGDERKRATEVEESDELRQDADGSERATEVSNTTQEAASSTLATPAKGASGAVDAANGEEEEETVEFDQTFATAEPGEHTLADHAQEEGDELDESGDALEGHLHQTAEHVQAEAEHEEEYDEDDVEATGPGDEGGEEGQVEGEHDDTVEPSGNDEVEGQDEAPADEYEDELLEYEEEANELEGLDSNDTQGVSKPSEGSGVVEDTIDADAVSLSSLGSKRPLEEEAQLVEPVAVLAETKRHKAE